MTDLNKFRNLSVNDLTEDELDEVLESGLEQPEEKMPSIGRDTGSRNLKKYRPTSIKFLYNA